MNEEGLKQPGRKKLPLLVELATSECTRNVSKLEDVGDTPFHLLVPILKRMNFKQLSHVEENSSQIMPYSDQFWRSHIVKEFPERPNPPDRLLLSRRYLIEDATGQGALNREMPLKSLFYRYMHERELFRKDSTERLRNITEKLRKEKSANSIISVPELLKDPTVRQTRQRFPSGIARGSVSAKSSILNKVRKDLQNRSLMFPKYSQNVKKYDPYDAFRKRSQSDRGNASRLDISRNMTQKSIIKSVPRSTTSSKDKLESTRTLFQDKVSQIKENRAVLSSAPRESPPEGKIGLSSSDKSTQTIRQISHTRKRKAEPSIFLTGSRNRKPRVQPDQVNLKQKALAGETGPCSFRKTVTKSSIFN